MDINLLFRNENNIIDFKEIVFENIRTDWFFTYDKSFSYAGSTPKKLRLRKITY